METSQQISQDLAKPPGLRNLPNWAIESVPCTFVTSSLELNIQNLLFFFILLYFAAKNHFRWFILDAIFMVCKSSA